MLLDMLRFYLAKFLDLLIFVEDIYSGILTVAGAGFLSFMGVMVIVELPRLAIEEITKKKMPVKIINRAKLVLTVCATICYIYILCND